MIEHTLTDDEYAELMAACEPVPYMVFGGVGPSSPQENANRVWQRFGRKHGFDWCSVTPSKRPGATQRSFMANLTVNDEAP